MQLISKLEVLQQVIDNIFHHTAIKLKKELAKLTK